MTLADIVGVMSGPDRVRITKGSPKALSPYEVARQTRIQTRAMVIAMQRG